MTECGLQTIEESCECFSIQLRFFEIDSEQRWRQSKSQDAASQIGVFIFVERVAFDINIGMAVKETREHSGTDSFANHPQLKCPRAADHFKCFIRIKKGAFDIKHIPE